MGMGWENNGVNLQNKYVGNENKNGYSRFVDDAIFCDSWKALSQLESFVFSIGLSWEASDSMISQADNSNFLLFWSEGR